MTVSSPLIRVKAALLALRAEGRGLELQLGVIGHAVMQSRVEHKLRVDGGGGGGGGGDAGDGGAARRR